MDQQKVKKYPLKGKRRPVPLHNRIIDYSNKNSILGEQLLAIKWLCNDSSHSGNSLIKGDVLDAYEILENVLNEIFEKKTQRLKQLVKKINRRKGQ
jgi:hypothetical protein